MYACESRQYEVVKRLRGFVTSCHWINSFSFARETLLCRYFGWHLGGHERERLGVSLLASPLFPSLFLSSSLASFSLLRTLKRIQTPRPDSLCSWRIKREICEFARGIPVICEEESGKLGFVFNPSRNTRFVERCTKQEGAEGTGRATVRRKLSLAKRMWYRGKLAGSSSYHPLARRTLQAPTIRRL